MRGSSVREVEVAGERHSADVVVINVGCRPSVPPIPGLDGAGWLDNASVMELRELPAHLVVLGGGYIGREFAQMFRRFGSEVPVIEALDRLLPAAQHRGPRLRHHRHRTGQPRLHPCG